MKTKNLFLKRSGLIIALLILLLPAFSIHAQDVFDASNPAGKYVITDYMNKKITLNLSKGASSDTRGSGTITINGRTLRGNWGVTSFGNEEFLSFETYNNIRMTYYLPSGSAKTDQIIISQDGRASYNISELLKTDADWIKVKRVSGPSKKAGSKKKSRK